MEGQRGARARRHGLRHAGLCASARFFLGDKRNANPYPSSRGSAPCQLKTASLARLPVVRPGRPVEPLVLYDMEGAHMAAVRERSPRCTSTRDSPLYQVESDFVRGTELGGNAVSLLRQEHDATMYSEEIVGTCSYLRRSRSHRFYRASRWMPLLAALQTGISLGRGVFARSAKDVAKPLSLWSFEGSPYARLVRERLTELEIPYTLHNLGKEHWAEAGPAVRRITPNPYVPREGGKRHAFWSEHGRVQVPFLEDPNTGSAMFSSGKIIDYLERS